MCPGISHGTRPSAVASTAAHKLYPERCTCGHTAFAMMTPSQTHQVIELPPLRWSPTGCCIGAAVWGVVRGTRPASPRACHGLWAAVQCPAQRTGWDVWQRAADGADLLCVCLRVPLSLGAIQKVLDRVTQAIAPHYEAIAGTLAERRSTTLMKPRGSSPIRCMVVGDGQ